MSLFFSACSTTSSDVRHAEEIFKDFQCQGLDENQLSYNTMQAYHEKMLYGSKRKARSYLESYKKGEKLFKIPLSDVMQQQYETYKEACKHLGGL